MPIILIDPGHGGTDSGNKFNGMIEKELTLDLAIRLEEKLFGTGIFDTVLSRKEDRGISLNEKANIAKYYKANPIVSIHFIKAKEGIRNGP